MLQNINNEINKDIAILYASNQYDKEEKEINYKDLIEEEYVLLTDPIKRIADMNY